MKVTISKSISPLFQNAGHIYMITIIIPVHNEHDNLKTLLPALNCSSLTCPMEIIVALSNDNSDNCDEIDIDGNVCFLKSSKKGRAVQMNTAAANAKGNILVFLHADVRPPKSFLLDIKTALKEGYDAGFFSYRFDKKSLLLKINASFTGQNGIFTGGGDQCLFIRKQIFFGLGKLTRSR